MARLFCHCSEQGIAKAFRGEIDDSIQFQEYGSRMIYIHNPIESKAEYVNIEFSDIGFSLVSSTFYSVLNRLSWVRYTDKSKDKRTGEFRSVTEDIGYHLFHEDDEQRV
jgi:hypothetical protein